LPIGAYGNPHIFAPVKTEDNAFNATAMDRRLAPILYRGWRSPLTSAVTPAHFKHTPVKAPAWVMDSSVLRPNGVEVYTGRDSRDARVTCERSQERYGSAWKWQWAQCDND